MSHWITMVTPHGPMNGWSAEPDDKPQGGVVLVHDIFGVNDDMRQIAEQYAENGYLTVVPALFDKIQSEVELGYSPEDIQFGNRLAKEMGLKVAAELVAITADAIAHAGDLSIIGYGWGGEVALLAARSLSLPCIVYCEADVFSWQTEQASMPVLAHCTTHDNGGEKSHREQRTNLLVHLYIAEHGFYRVSSAQHQHRENADLARQRSLDFLRTHIRRQDH